MKNIIKFLTSAFLIFAIPTVTIAIGCKIGGETLANSLKQGATITAIIMLLFFSIYATNSSVVHAFESFSTAKEDIENIFCKIKSRFKIKTSKN